MIVLKTAYVRLYPFSVRACVLSNSQIRDRVTAPHIHTPLLPLSHLPFLSVFSNCHHSSSVLNLSPPNPFPTTPFPSHLLFCSSFFLILSDSGCPLCLCVAIHFFGPFLFSIKGRKSKRFQRAHSDNERGNSGFKPNGDPDYSSNTD